jgi:hypothetical protein
MKHPQPFVNKFDVNTFQQQMGGYQINPNYGMYTPQMQNDYMMQQQYSIDYQMQNMNLNNQHEETGELENTNNDSLDKVIIDSLYKNFY